MIMRYRIGASYYLRLQSGQVYLNGSCAHTPHIVPLLISVMKCSGAGGRYRQEYLHGLPS